MIQGRGASLPTLERITWAFREALAGEILQNHERIRSAFRTNRLAKRKLFVKKSVFGKRLIRFLYYRIS